MDDIKGVLRGFRRWEIGHVKRGANSAAHGPAKVATKEPIDQIWMEEIPSSVFDIISLEQFALFVYSFMPGNFV